MSKRTYRPNISHGSYRTRILYPLTPSTVCEDCATRPAKHRHHLDRNPENVSRDNIALLCRECHWARHRLINGEPVPRVTVSAAVEENIRDTIDAIAKRDGLTRSQVTERLLLVAVAHRLKPYQEEELTPTEIANIRQREAEAEAHLREL
jgi:hypothetical protein